MSLFLGVLSAAVALDDSEYQKKLKGLETSSSDSFQKIAKAAASYLTVTSILNFGRQAIQTYSDLEEATNKFDVVFQGFTKHAGDAVDELRKKFGQSELSAKQMLSGTGDILTGFGFDRKLALDMSVLTAQLGADLASFTNYAGGAAGATDALTKAMLGETESAKMLGIVIKQDSEEYKNLVEQAMTTGVQIKEGGEKIVVTNEQQAKAVAALALAYQQSKNAQGDFLRSQNSIANQTQILKNNFDEALAVLGKDGASAYSDLLKSTNKLLKLYTELSPATRSLINNTAMLASGFVILKTAGILGVAKSAIAGTIALLHYATVMDTCTFAGTKMTIQQGSLQASMKATAVAANIVTAAIGGAVAMLSIHYMLMQRDASIRDERFRSMEKEVKKEEDKLRLMRQTHSEDMQNLDRLKELSKYQRLSSDEQKEADEIAQKLKEDYDDLSISVDKVNHSVSVGADAWKKMTEEQRSRELNQANKVYSEQLRYIEARRIQMANEFEFGDMLGGIDYTKIANDLRAFHLNSNLERQLSYAKRTRDMLLKRNQKEEAEQLDAYIVELEKAIVLRKDLYKIRDAEVTDSEAERKKKESKDRRDALEELNEFEWQILFDTSDAEIKLDLLREKADKIFSQSGLKDKFKTTASLLNADTSILTAEEIKLRKQLLEIESERLRIKEEINTQEERTLETYKKRKENEDKAYRELQRYKKEQAFEKLPEDVKLATLLQEKDKLLNQVSWLQGNHAEIDEFSKKRYEKMTTEERLREQLELERELEKIERKRKDILEKQSYEVEKQNKQRQENYQKYLDRKKEFDDFFAARKRSKAEDKFFERIAALQKNEQYLEAQNMIQNKIADFQQKADYFSTKYKNYLKQSEEDGHLSEEEEKLLDEYEKKFKRYYSDIDRLENARKNLQPPDADGELDKRHDRARETIGAWSLAALSRMTADSPEVQTARNTKETSRKMTELLELEKQRPVLTY